MLQEQQGKQEADLTAGRQQAQAEHAKLQQLQASCRQLERQRNAEQSTQAGLQKAVDARQAELQQLEAALDAANAKHSKHSI